MYDARPVGRGVKQPFDHPLDPYVGVVHVRPAAIRAYSHSGPEPIQMSAEQGQCSSGW
jgi:hypothetical protein